MDRTITIRIKGTWLRYLAVILVTVLVVAPTAVWASHGFTDVPDSNIFHADIDWLADNGVTLGCNPPVNDEFCPKDTVSREQMAAFMHRLATNQVVDAASVEGFTVAELSPRAAFASSGNLPDQNGAALTATITAPVNGILIINASVNVLRNIASPAGVFCSIDIDEGQVAGSLMGVLVSQGDATFEPCGTGGAAVVPPGVHTIDFDIAGLSTNTFLDDGFLTVLFVPFDAEGQTPSP